MCACVVRGAYKMDHFYSRLRKDDVKMGDFGDRNMMIEQCVQHQDVMVKWSNDLNTGSIGILAKDKPFYHCSHCWHGPKHSVLEKIKSKWRKRDEKIRDRDEKK